MNLLPLKDLPWVKVCAPVKALTLAKFCIPIWEVAFEPKFSFPAFDKPKARMPALDATLVKSPDTIP